MLHPIGVAPLFLLLALIPMEVCRSCSIDAALRVERVEAPAAAAVRRTLHEPGRLTLDGTRCPACQSTVHGRFCSTCGEHAPHRQPQTTWEFLKRGATQLLDADSRLLRSLYLLLVRPGALTNRFLEGHRRHYVGPLKLFALVNVAFVLIVNASGGPTTFRNSLYYHLNAGYPHQKIAERWVGDRIDAPEGWTLEAALQREDSLQTDAPRATSSSDSPLSAEDDPLSTVDAGGATADSSAIPPAIEALDRYRDYAQTFNRQAGRLSETLVFLFIPALAGLFWGSAAVAGTLAGRRGLASIVQATHFMTALLVLLVVIMWSLLGALSVVQAAGGGPPGEVPELVFLATLIGAIMLYLAMATRRVEQASWTRAIAQAVVLAVAVLVLQRFYTSVLFVVAFFVTG